MGKQVKMFNNIIMIPTIPGFKIVYAYMQPNLVVTNTFNMLNVLVTSRFGYM